MIGRAFVDIKLEEVTRLLCFESHAQAQAFLRSYSLVVEKDGQVTTDSLLPYCFVQPEPRRRGHAKELLSPCCLAGFLLLA